MPNTFINDKYLIIGSETAISIDRSTDGAFQMESMAITGPEEKNLILQSVAWVHGEVNGYMN